MAALPLLPEDAQAWVSDLQQEVRLVFRDREQFVAGSCPSYDPLLPPGFLALESASIQALSLLVEPERTARVEGRADATLAPDPFRLAAGGPVTTEPDSRTLRTLGRIRYTQGNRGRITSTSS